MNCKLFSINLPLYNLYNLGLGYDNKVYPAAIVLLNQAGTYPIGRRPLSVPFLNCTSVSAIVRTVSKFPQNRKCLWQQRRWKRLFDFFKLVPATIQYTVLKDKTSCIVARRLSNGAGGWVKPKGGLRSSTHWITTPPFCLTHKRKSLVHIFLSVVFSLAIFPQ